MISSNSQSLFGLRKLPARYGGLVMPFFLSALMTFLVSMISTLERCRLERQILPGVA